jgi:hypothetical protein
VDTINARGCVAVIAAAVVGVTDEVVPAEIVEDCGGYCRKRLLMCGRQDGVQRARSAGTLFFKRLHLGLP